MDDDIQTGGESDEGDSLSETIAAALEEDQGDDLISELGDAQDSAGETQEADGQALPDDEGEVETPGDGGTDQTDEGEPPSDQVQEEAAPDQMFFDDVPALRLDQYADRQAAPVEILARSAPVEARPT